MVEQSLKMGHELIDPIDCLTAQIQYDPLGYGFKTNNFRPKPVKRLAGDQTYQTTDTKKGS